MESVPKNFQMLTNLPAQDFVAAHWAVHQNKFSVPADKFRLHWVPETTVQVVMSIEPPLYAAGVRLAISF